MLGLNMCITIQTLWKQGKNKSEISRLTNHDWKTVHNVIKALEQGKSKPDKKPRKSLLDPYREKILELLEMGLSIVRIHEELKAQG